MIGSMSAHLAALDIQPSQHVTLPFQTTSLPSQHRQQPAARVLTLSAPSVTPERSNADVMHVFTRHRDLGSLPVVEHGRPIGLISRNIFLSQMSKPYYRELYERKSCIAFMDKQPLIVDADTPIETLAALAVESGDKALADGFIITQDGRYSGVGAGLDLMRELVALQTERNHLVMQSIDYASTIQRAMLSASQDAIQQGMPDSGLAWEPRDRVGGDFYHVRLDSNGWFFAIGDCTGHGVPGAFLTLIATATLDHALTAHGPRNPALLMAAVSRGIKRALSQRSATEHAGSDDGLDAAFLWYDNDSRTLTSAHARMPLMVLAPDSDVVTTIDGERTGLGYADTPEDMQWRNHHTPLVAHTVLCCCTDGVTTQIGGPRNIAYGKRRLRAALLRHRDAPMSVMIDTILTEHRAYQGEQTRRDDLTLFGLRVN